MAALRCLSALASTDAGRRATSATGVTTLLMSVRAVTTLRQGCAAELCSAPVKHNMPRALAQECKPSAASGREVSQEAEGLLQLLRGVGEQADHAQQW